MQRHCCHSPHCRAEHREETPPIGACPLRKGVAAGGWLLEQEAAACELGDVPTASAPQVNIASRVSSASGESSAGMA